MGVLRVDARRQRSSSAQGRVQAGRSVYSECYSCLWRSTPLMSRSALMSRSSRSLREIGDEDENCLLLCAYCPLPMPIVIACCHCMLQLRFRDSRAQRKEFEPMQPDGLKTSSTTTIATTTTITTTTTAIHNSTPSHHAFTSSCSRFHIGLCFDAHKNHELEIRSPFWRCQSAASCAAATAA